MDSPVLSQCRQAVSKEPDNSLNQLRLARAALQAGQVSEAVEAARKAEKSPEHRLPARLILGRTLLMSGDFSAAEKMAEKLLAQKADAEAHNLRGEARGNLGRSNEAAEDFRAAATLNPKQSAYQFNLAITLQLQGDNLAAIDSYRRVLAIDPANQVAMNGLAVTQVSAALYPEAIDTFQILLERWPDDARSWAGLGAALQFQGKYAQAKSCYERAIEFDPELVEAHSNMGTVLQGLRDIPGSEASYRHALKLNPRHQDALAGLASVLDWQGRYQEAIDGLEAAVEQGSRHPDLLVTWAGLTRRFGRQEQAVVRLQEELNRPGIPRVARERMYFVLGDMHNDKKQYDDAFTAYRRGNRLKDVQFDAAGFNRMVENVSGYFSRDRISQFASLPFGENMIFIVGMPRSGSSLIEQILASHPNVFAAGELSYLSDLVFSIQEVTGKKQEFPFCLDQLSVEDLSAAAETYLEKATEGLADGKTRVTDKMPSNFIHLGLINLLFPKARVIHSQRHPLDIGLSCYFQNFSSLGMHFTFDLQDIGYYYRAYRRLMDHYRNTINLPMLEVVYEDLVEDFEAQVRKLLAFAGLEWDPACLEFHRLERNVITSSYAQVRQPIYRDSSGRYKNYLEHLQPLIDILGDDLETWRQS
ncbi:MAG: sulfotransferase [Gammaproteobacteria bacterium]|nr:sulfotransferase [Gammaproteobacteria bacterium]